MSIKPSIETVCIGEDITLYHADCLELLPRLEPKSINMVFTDPPYGHKNNDGDLIENREKALGTSHINPNAEARPIANDCSEANEIFRAALPLLKAVLSSPGCCCCCCCGGGPDPQFARWSLWMDEVFSFKQMVIWDKGPIGMGWHYRRSYETVLVGEMKGKSKWHDETGQIENIIRPGKYGIKKIIPSKNEHPTPKPPELAAHFMSLHTQRGESVLDPFMGAGSTGIAAVRTGRKFVGIELEKRWFDMACERIDNELRQGVLAL